MKKLSALLNTLFIGALLWIVTALLCRAFLPLMPTLVVASAVSLTATVIGLLVALSSREVRISAPEAKRVRRALLLYAPERRREFLYGLLTLCARAHTDGDGNLLAVLDGEERCVHERVRFAPLQADDVAQVWRSEPSVPCAIVCDAATEEARAVARELNVAVIDFSALYDLMHSIRAYPHTDGVPKKSRARLLSTLLFSRSRVRPYLFTALVLAITSLWSGMRVYYLVASVAACVLALACAVLPERISDHSA